MTKRFTLIALALLLLCSTAWAYDLNSSCGTITSDWNSIGCVLKVGAFGGDFLFFGIIMLGMFAMFMVQTNMPASAGIGIGLVVIVALGSTMLGDYYGMLINLALVVIGAMLALALMHFVRR